MYFNLYKSVVGLFGKFPNWHLYQSNSGYSLANLWATIEILISAPAVNKIYF